MKKIIKFILTVFSLALLFAVTACAPNIDIQEESETQKESETTVKTGSASFSIVVPDYYAMAGLARRETSRAIAPQTANVKLSYKKSGEWVTHTIVALSEAEKTAIPNAPAGFAGSVYKCSFKNVPSRVYASGAMKIELLDSGNNVISEGTNNSTVSIVTNETTQAAFYTIPTSSNFNAGTLAAGEMKFLKKQFSSTSACTLAISVTGGNAYPDVVIFNENGTFEQYISVSSASKNIDCTEYKGTTKYIGFWSATATSYSTEFVSVPNGGDLFFANILNSADWMVTNASAITESDGVYTFDGKKQTGGFKRTVLLNQAKTLSFKVQTNLFESDDGSLQFLIDDVVVASYTGRHGIWQNVLFEMDAGCHTIEWKRYDTEIGYTHNITQFVSVKDFAFKEPIQALESINQTFDETIDENMWIGAGFSFSVLDAAPIYTQWAQYGDALVDTHGKVYKLDVQDFIDEGNSTYLIEGNSSLTIYKVTVSEESVLSFDYKCDLINDGEHNCYFRVFIDGSVSPSLETTGSGQMWQKGSVILSAGTHSIKFSAEKYNGNYYWYYDGENAVFLDNITLAANKTASVDIYPKGLQETYIGGDTIQFSAKALRSDGSVISGKSVTWSSTGGSITSNGLFSPESTAGTYRVTATIDGKTASNQTVKVHGTDYLADSVTINGHEFTGAITNGNGTRSDTTNITWAAPTPDYKSFTADGFFILKGTANDTYGYVKVTKGDYETSYILPTGNFEQRIWLRFGDGEYTVLVSEMQITYRSPDGDYEGAVEHYGSCYASGPKTMTFTVTNSTDLTYSAEECAYLMPSYICQSDDFIVSNAFNAVIAELPDNATTGQKLQALHDWETKHHYYDHTSSDDKTKRKRQDAVHVVKYGMAVCEGYANLYAALVRMLGVKTAYQSSSSMNHGWVKCYYKGEWKLVDVTWDDPDRTAEENYKYFLIGLNGVDNDHYDYSTEYGRSVLPVSHIPHIKDMPDGWY